jgi:hypothetical protein
MYIKKLNGDIIYAGLDESIRLMDTGRIRTLYLVEAGA